MRVGRKWRNRKVVIKAFCQSIPIKVLILIHTHLVIMTRKLYERIVWHNIYLIVHLNIIVNTSPASSRWLRVTAESRIDRSAGRLYLSGCHRSRPGGAVLRQKLPVGPAPQTLSVGPAPSRGRLLLCWIFSGVKGGSHKSFHVNRPINIEVKPPCFFKLV